MQIVCFFILIFAQQSRMIMVHYSKEKMYHYHAPINKVNAGGKRQGAGRKPNSGKYKEPTHAIRVPESIVAPLTAWLERLTQDGDVSQHAGAFPMPDSLSPAQRANIMLPALSPAVLSMPFYDCSVSAGFPSPADDSFGITMDLNKHLVQNAPATFFVRTSGESMLGAGIHDGDLLVVDRSLKAMIS